MTPRLLRDYIYGEKAKIDKIDAQHSQKLQRGEQRMRGDIKKAEEECEREVAAIGSQSELDKTTAEERIASIRAQFAEKKKKLETAIEKFKERVEKEKEAKIAEIKHLFFGPEEKEDKEGEENKEAAKNTYCINRKAHSRFRTALRSLQASDLEAILFGNNTDRVYSWEFRFSSEDSLSKSFLGIEKSYRFFSSSNETFEQASEQFKKLYSLCLLINIFFEENDEEDEDENNTNAFSYAYGILMLFGKDSIEKTLDTFISYLSSHNLLTHRAPLHDAFIHEPPEPDEEDDADSDSDEDSVELANEKPDDESDSSETAKKPIVKLSKRPPLFNLAIWQQMITQTGPRAFRFFNFAIAIEKKLQRPPRDFQEVVDTAKFAYENFEVAPALAEVCATYAQSEKVFEKCLEIEKRKKTKCALPDVIIAGEECGHPNYYFILMPFSDLKGYFLGEDTSSCQSAGHNGHQVVADAMMLEHNAFYLLVKAKVPNTAKSDLFNQNHEINDDKFERVGGGYTWGSLADNLTIDSWEDRRPSDDAIAVPLIERFAETVTSLPGSRVLRVTIGKGGQTPVKWKKQSDELDNPEFMLEGTQYRDSRKQALVYFNKSKAERLQAGLEKILEEIGIIDPTLRQQIVASFKIYSFKQYEAIKMLFGLEYFNDYLKKVEPSVLAGLAAQCSQKQINFFVAVLTSLPKLAAELFINQVESTDFRFLIQKPQELGYTLASISTPFYSLVIHMHLTALHVERVFRFSPEGLSDVLRCLGELEQLQLVKSLGENYVSSIPTIYLNPIVLSALHEKNRLAFLQKTKNENLIKKLLKRLNETKNINEFDGFIDLLKLLPPADRIVFLRDELGSRFFSRLHCSDENVYYQCIIRVFRELPISDQPIFLRDVLGLGQNDSTFLENPTPLSAWNTFIKHYDAAENEANTPDADYMCALSDPSFLQAAWHPANHISTLKSCLSDLIPQHRRVCFFKNIAGHAPLIERADELKEIVELMPESLRYVFISEVLGRERVRPFLSWLYYTRQVIRLLPPADRILFFKDIYTREELLRNIKEVEYLRNDLENESEEVITCVVELLGFKNKRDIVDPLLSGPLDQIPKHKETLFKYRVALHYLQAVVENETYAPELREIGKDFLQALQTLSKNRKIAEQDLSHLVNVLRGVGDKIAMPKESSFYFGQIDNRYFTGQTSYGKLIAGIVVAVLAISLILACTALALISFGVLAPLSILGISLSASAITGTAAISTAGFSTGIAVGASLFAHSGRKQGVALAAEKVEKVMDQHLKAIRSP